MAKKNLKNSVPEEQFSDLTENTGEKKLDNQNSTELESNKKESSKKDSIAAIPVKKKKTEKKVKETAKTKKKKKESEDIIKEDIDQITNSDLADIEKEVKKEEKITTPKKKKESKKEVKEKIDITEQEEKKEEEKPVDYTKLDKADLIKCLIEILNDKPVQEIKNDVEIIKANFYKRHKAETEKIKAKFIKEGGNLEDFKPQEDNLENELKELLNRYKNLKADYNKFLEVEKENNLEKKYEIIEEIKDLINRKESINKTFQEFRELQQRWREIGLVPQQKVKDLWETYHHNVEKFYDYIKINKELRDLDLKKNLEEKLVLCEKAEDLLLETSVIKSFEELQKLHERWREIGPVPHEYKESTWERFKSATTIINKKYQQHFEDIKQAQKKNLEAKTMLCEKIEDINTLQIKNHKEWERKSKEVKELQKVWRTIGFAPKKYNNKIYMRFRSACDQFFARKREFYAENKEIQTNNLQTKLDLCEQAEALKDSTDWKKTTEDLIILQNKWKEVGPVPKKQSDEVWKRFRSACDHFFNMKKEFFSNIDDKYEENLKKKYELIAEIKAFKASEDVEESIKKLKEFQRKWAEIGFVPFKEKEKVQNAYRDAINFHFDKLNVDDNKRKILKYKNKIATIHNSPKFETRLKSEREKFINKLKKLENNIVLWENNIGFFAKSKSAESMIDDVKKKIEKAQEEIKILEEKINIIDNIE